MATSTREIKGRIRSVKNIAQITKAMEMVSAAKMRKAQALALASRPYSQLVSKLLEEVAAKADASEIPLINRVWKNNGMIPKQKVLVILITSDKGLSGSFNTNVINKALEIIKTADDPNSIEFITIGRKGADVIKRINVQIIAAFPGKDKGVTSLDAKPIAQIAVEEFLKFRFEKVFIVYTDFVSTLVQKPNVLQLLPLMKHESENMNQMRITIEPNPNEVLEKLVQRSIEFAVYQTLVEAVASEHSARMVAMRNANSAASDLMDELTLNFNQARQAGITRELSEISAAKLAMEG